MAKASVKVTEVKKIVKVDESSIVLEMSVEEAQTLYDVFMRIQGQPGRSRRGNTDHLMCALKPVLEVECGLPSWRDDFMYKDDIKQSLVFQDEDGSDW